RGHCAVLQLERADATRRQCADRGKARAREADDERDRRNDHRRGRAKSAEIPQCEHHLLGVGSNRWYGYPPTARANPAYGLYMRNTPNDVSPIGAFNAAEMPSASTFRVSRGSTIPSSQSRAVE